MLTHRVGERHNWNLNMKLLGRQMHAQVDQRGSEISMS